MNATAAVSMAVVVVVVVAVVVSIVAVVDAVVVVVVVVVVVAFDDGDNHEASPRRNFLRPAMFQSWRRHNNIFFFILQQIDLPKPKLKSLLLFSVFVIRPGDSILFARMLETENCFLR